MNNYEADSPSIELSQGSDGVIHQNSSKPRFFIDKANPDETVETLRDILSVGSGLYDRGMVVRLARSQIRGGMVIQMMRAPGIVRTAHTACRPYKFDKEGAEVDAPLPETGDHVSLIGRANGIFLS